MLARAIGSQGDLAHLVVRLIVGVIFVAHGLGKFQIGINTITGFLQSVGIPAAGFFGWALPLIEIIGGLALIFGLATRLAALLLAIVMVVAIIKVKIAIGLIVPMAQPGVGMELDLALLAGLLAILLEGPGRFSLELGALKREVI